jgi:paraquat-inducible protein B
LLAVAIGGWLAWDTLSKQGPTIRVTFESGEGLQPGQSQLKYKDIVFGTVKRLDLTPDKWHVVVTIETTKEAEPLLAEKTVFWVVKPRLFAGNISGLDTLLSGSYVAMVPDVTGTPSKTFDFIGQEEPPILEAHTAGTTFYLKSPRIGSIAAGSPIFFRDLTVGQVLGWDSKDLADSVTIRAFVKAPYDSYVHLETRFWNASGLSVKLGSDGIKVQMESLRALLFGGIAFETPPDELHAGPAEPDHVFPLFGDRDLANAASYTRTLAGISYFDSSVRGLAAGSDVTMHGLKIGSVTDVRLKPDPEKGTIVAVVRFDVQPERIVGVGQRLVKDDSEAVGLLLSRGMRASLQSANLLTGQQMVALEFVPDAPPAPVVKEGNSFVIPTTESGGFAGLSAAATDVLNKLNAIPFGPIGTNLNGVLGSLNKATEGPQLKDAVNSLSSLLASLNKATEGPQLKEAVANLASALATAQRALNSVNKLAVSVDTGYGHDTKFSRDLDRLLVQTDEAVRAVRALADLLARHPEALIKGRP